MDNWTYFATYYGSASTTRALPASFSELFITGTTETSRTPTPVQLLIPQIIISNASSVGQSLGLVQSTDHTGSFVMLRIWSGGMICAYFSGGNDFGTYYDVYYR